MTMERGGAPTPPRTTLPTGGVFAISELMPILRGARDEMVTLREEWLQLREDADRKKAEAKRVRAACIVTLRAWGNDTTHSPIRTSAERQEWANADPEVQQAELDADLAQTVQMAAREAYNDAQAFFNTLQTLSGWERDHLRAERHGQ